MPDSLPYVLQAEYPQEIDGYEASTDVFNDYETCLQARLTPVDLKQDQTSKRSIKSYLRMSTEVILGLQSPAMPSLSFSFAVDAKPWKTLGHVRLRQCPPAQPHHSTHSHNIRQASLSSSSCELKSFKIFWSAFPPPSFTYPKSPSKTPEPFFFLDPGAQSLVNSRTPWPDLGREEAGKVLGGATCQQTVANCAWLLSTPHRRLAAAIFALRRGTPSHSLFEEVAFEALSHDRVPQNHETMAMSTVTSRTRRGDLARHAARAANSLLAQHSWRVSCTRPTPFAQSVAGKGRGAGELPRDRIRALQTREYRGGVPVLEVAGELALTAVLAHPHGCRGLSPSGDALDLMCPACFANVLVPLLLLYNAITRRRAALLIRPSGAPTTRFVTSFAKAGVFTPHLHTTPAWPLKTEMEKMSATSTARFQEGKGRLFNPTEKILCDEMH
ncbi:hypothetical protein GGF50DRAFT_89779 [Schizophyllum commune]